MVLISGGFGLQQLEAGSHFPSQKLKSGSVSESAVLATRLRGPVTRPWLVHFVEMNVNKEMESSELLGGKKSTHE